MQRLFKATEPHAVTEIFILPQPTFLESNWNTSRVKKISLFALLLFGLVVPSSIPAQALFGLSACEKAKKAISREEQIGLVLFQDYAKQRQLLFNMDSPTMRDLINVIGWLPNVYDSDNKVFAIVEKNQNCFSAKDVARARSKKDANQKAIKTLNSIAAKVPTGNQYFLRQSLTYENIQSLRETYRNFYSFIGNKRLN